MIKRISRYGSYCIILKDNNILLTLKKSGPYKGLWGLPGGKIEFNESPQDAIIREVFEETSHSLEDLQLIGTSSYCKIFEDYELHHVGIIYKSLKIKYVHAAIPEEEFALFNLRDINKETLTPFAKEALDNFIALSNKNS